MYTFLLTTVFSIIIFFVIIYFQESPVPNSKPYSFPPSPLLKPPRSFFNTISNYNLRKPISILMFKTESFFLTGTDDGFIMKVFIETGEINVFLKPTDFGANVKDDSFCERSFFSVFFSKNQQCGRVLGMKFNENGDKIIITNSNFGIFEYNIKTKKLKRIVGGHIFYRDALEVDNKIFFIESSKKYLHSETLSIILSNHQTGSFSFYDPGTGKITVLLSDMSFPNGFELSKDRKFIYICETLKVKIIRYCLETRQFEDFIENLYLYPSSISVDEDSDSLFIAGIPRSYIYEKYFTPKFIENFSKLPKLFQNVVMYFIVIQKDGMFLEVNNLGDLVNIIWDARYEVFSLISSVVRYGDYFLVGSSIRNCVCKFKIGMKIFGEQGMSME